jgi:hypothetical protein
MSRHRAVRNLDLDGKYALVIAILTLDYLDDGVEDEYDEEPNGILIVNIIDM